MPKIIFQISKKQDAKNWRRTKQLKHLPYGLTKTKNNRKKLKDFSAKEMEKLKMNKLQLEKYFDKNEAAIFLTIKKLTNQPAYSKIFRASFTTAGLMPYDVKSRWFMVPAEKKLKRQIAIVIHELLHLQIAHYYTKYCRQNRLNSQQFLELNELLVYILSNPLLKKLNLPKNRPYPKHKKLIKKLKKIWKKNNNFQKTLDNSIMLLKK